MEKTKKRLLEENKLTVEQVEICSCIIVTGLPPNTTKDTIMYYFENKKRNNGGDVANVEFTPGEDLALVYFEDFEGIINSLTVKIAVIFPYKQVWTLISTLNICIEGTSFVQQANQAWLD